MRARVFAVVAEAAETLGPRVLNRGNQTYNPTPSSSFSYYASYKRHLPPQRFMSQQRGVKEARAPPPTTPHRLAAEKVESGFASFVPTPKPTRAPSQGISTTRVVWLPYLWVGERIGAFFRGEWVRSYKIQRVFLLFLALVAAVSNYNNQALYDGVVAEHEESTRVYQQDLVTLLEQEAQLRAHVLATARAWDVGSNPAHAAVRETLLAIATQPSYTTTTTK